MENTNPTSSSKTPLLLLSVVVLIAVVSILLRYQYVVIKESPKSFSSENVQLQSVDVGNKTGVEKLPAGFPQSIPVELGSINSSETLSYPDRKVTVYNVSYFSSKQQEELFVTYGNFLKKEGYKITRTDKSAAHMLYEATKDKTDVSITITPQTGGMRVLISVVVRE